MQLLEKLSLTILLGLLLQNIKIQVRYILHIPEEIMCQEACLFLAGMILGALIVFHATTTFFPCVEALEVHPVTSAFPFTKAGVIAGGVQYAPLAFVFNFSAMIARAEHFKQITLNHANDSSTQRIMAHYATVTFADEPLEDLLASQDILLHSADRGKRQSGLQIVSAVTSSWALAEVYMVKSTVNQLQSNQIKIGHAVEATVARLQEHDRLFTQVNDSLAAVKQSTETFSMYIGYFGFFSASRHYSTDVKSFCEGIRHVSNGHLSANLVNASLTADAFQQLINTADQHHLKPVFPDWQQIFREEVSFYFDQELLHVIVHIPLVSKDAQIFDLYQYHPTPWLWNSTLVEFRPLHSMVVVNSKKIPKANLPASFLHQCRQIGAHHLCEQPLITSKTLDTCEGQLFLGNLDSAASQCPTRLLPQQVTFASLNRTAFILFTPNSVELFERCPDNDKVSPYSVNGLNIILSKDGCFITSTLFDTILGGSVVFHQDVNILVSHEPFYDRDVTARVPLLGSLKPFDGGKIRETIDKVIESDTLSHNWLLAIILVLLVIIFVIFVICYCVWKHKASIIKDVVAPELPTSIKDIVSDLLPTSVPPTKTEAIPMKTITEDHQNEIKTAIFDSLRPQVQTLIEDIAVDYLKALGLKQ